MKKDFQKWNGEKSEIHEKKDRPFFHEMEIWFASFGVNIGFEQDGKGDEFLRPVAIIRKFNNEVFWGIPTTKKKKSNKYYFEIKFGEDKSTSVILSQMRLMDSKRLRYKIGDVSKGDFEEIKNRLISFLKKDDSSFDPLRGGPKPFET